jgi:putative PEP-CTERM system histidine kinase
MESFVSGLAAVALFAVAAFVLVTKRSGSYRAVAFTLLLIGGTEVVAYISARDLYDAPCVSLVWRTLLSLVPATVIYFSLVYSRAASLRSAGPLWQAVLGGCLLLPAVVLAGALRPSSALESMRDEPLETWLAAGILIACVLALMNIEATFRSTSEKERRRIKFEAIGLSAILSALLFTVSQDLITRNAFSVVLPARSAIMVLGSGMILYSGLVRSRGVRVVISRPVIYRSVTLFGILSYLIILGLLSEGLHALGLSVGPALAFFLSFAGGVLLLVLMLSERLRRRARVFINKHFFAQKHDYRTAWIRFTGQLAACTTVRDLRNTVLSAYRGIFDLGGAALYLTEANGGALRLAAQSGLPQSPPEFVLQDNLRSYFLERDRVLCAADHECELSPDEALFVHAAKAQLIVPLVCNDEIEGVVVLGHQNEPVELIFEDYDLMKIMARQAAVSLVNARLSEELAASCEIAAVARISSFVMHDLKNLTSSLSLMVENAATNMGDPAFQTDMLDTIGKTLTKMRGLIHRLRKAPNKSKLNLRPVDVDALCRETLADISRSAGNADVVYAGEPVVAMIDGEEVRKVIMNLVQNSLDATNGRSSLISVQCGTNGHGAFIRVQDHGCGMTEAFMRDHLWKPFRTTKESGLGIGLYQSVQIAEAHGGTIEAESASGTGTVFTVHLPGAPGSALPDGQSPYDRTWISGATGRSALSDMAGGAE